MRRFRLLRTFIALSIVPAGLWYSGFGAPEPMAAGAAQQGRRGDNDARGGSVLRPQRCAVRQPGAADLAAIEQILSASGNRDNNQFVTVPVYWHVITTASGAGNVSSLVPAQMQVLNFEYANSGFRFATAGLQVIANNAWFFAEAGSTEEQQMKASLRQGGPDALNIYTTNGDVYLGWATLPFYYKFGPAYDGVVLWYASLPGGGAGGSYPDEPDGELTYDQGDTGTHEVGHWLGLDHTFGPGNGCTHPGDLVTDTPVEAEPQFLCQARDSCTGAAFRGTDPITNFMDYTDDVCMIEFTSEQSKRMRKQWHAFRDKKTRS
jgi:hypothetical protein